MGQLSEEPLRTGTEDQIDEMKLCLVYHQITDNWSVSQSASQPRLDAPGQQNLSNSFCHLPVSGRGRKEEMEPRNSPSFFYTFLEERLILHTFRVMLVHIAYFVFYHMSVNISTF